MGAATFTKRLIVRASSGDETGVQRWGLRVRRQRVFLLGYLLGIANVAFQWALQDAIGLGFWNSLLGLFDISAIVWVAVAASWHILSGSKEDAQASGLDIAFAGIVVLACLVPIRSAAASATTLLALYALLTTAPRSSLFKASAIALSIIVSLFWGGVLLALSGNALLNVDVALAGAVSGLKSAGNMLYFAGMDSSTVGGKFLVTSACSSLHGMSVAVLAFIVVTQYYELPMRGRVLFFGLVGVLGMIAVNIARLSIMGYFPAWFDWVHTGPGATITSWVSMMIVLLANMGGNWREITRSA